ncbi:DUF7620 family protein [Mycolicibacterium austroafricanum]|uniref:DUF7620 family protein n=1 Tax=Mycolicibacterium austroafricanum TaxID=39687 RepID=UPI001CA351BA|nr:hypothetical protein [Mycolicibacterium austroafricanum]QZT61223.1 hypothetical protein JN085_19845 [Mycolicibacterium austroafricanum]
MWPWSRQHRELEKARQGLEKAATEAVQAEERAKEVEKLARQSRAASARLRNEVALNGWTEKFQIAMGRRA